MVCGKITDSWLWWCFQVRQIFSSLKKSVFLNSSIHPPIHTFHRQRKSQKTRDRKSKLESKESKWERDDAVRAVIDVRTAWKEARHLRPFSLPLPTLTDCHQRRWGEYQPLFLSYTLRFFYTSSQPDHATVLPSTQTICYSFKVGYQWA